MKLLFTMATKSANLYARIEPDVKEQAEGILAALGIPASNAINMFYKQIILQRGLPFEVKMPSVCPVDISALSEAQMNAELEKGYAALQKLAQKAKELIWSSFLRRIQKLSQWNCLSGKFGYRRCRIRYS